MAQAVSSSSSDMTVGDPRFNNRIIFHEGIKSYPPNSSSNSKNIELKTLSPSTSMNQRSQSVGSRAAGVVDPVFSFSINLRRIGAGLQNLGNTCYLNSVLQCLTYTEPFAAYCHSGHHNNSCRAAGFCVMCALQNHVTNALQASGRILSPHHIVRNLRSISRNFRTKRQEDAHEYMVNLLESMHKCCLPSGIPTESPSAYEKSLVHKIFGGRLRSQVKCTQCGFCSNKYDPFLDLSLELYKADSLIKALKHFTATEQLDGGEKQYQCQHCKVKVRASKQLTIHNAPYVLSIHLKRFSPINHGKIDKRVDFEPTLNLKPFVSDQQGADLKYTLYGVLVHDGCSTRSGHYYCFVRTSSGLWHRLDDNKVRPVGEKVVLSEKAYMLFYVRDKSSPMKRSADVFRDNTIANSPKRLAIMQPIVNGKMKSAEKKICTKESKPSDISRVQPISTVKYSKNRDDILNAVLENKQYILTERTISQADNQVTSNGLQQTICHNQDEKQDIKCEESIPEVDNCTSNINCQTNKMLKLENPAIDTGSKTSIIENVCDQHAVAVVDKKAKAGEKLKLKMMGKRPHYFGRKQLLFAFLGIHKKQKNCIKHRLKSKSIVKDKGLAAVSVCAFQKESCSNINKEIKHEKAKYDMHYNSEFVCDTKSSSCSNNKPVLTILYQPEINSTSIVQSVSRHLKCFKHTTGPRWEDGEMPPVQSEDGDDAPRNKSKFQYEKRNETLDQGEKKKLKKSRRSSKGPYN